MSKTSEWIAALESESKQLEKSTEIAAQSVLAAQEKALRTIEEKSATIYKNAIKNQEAQAKQFAMKAVKISHKWGIINSILAIASVAMITLLIWGGWKLSEMKTEADNYTNLLNTFQVRNCQLERNGKMSGNWLCVQTMNDKNSLGKNWKAIAQKTE